MYKVRKQQMIPILTSGFDSAPERPATGMNIPIIRWYVCVVHKTVKIWPIRWI